MPKAIFASALVLFIASSALKADYQAERYLVEPETKVLVAKAHPALALKPAAHFRYLGRHPIKIRDVAIGERFVYGKITPDGIEKLLIVQLEAFTASNDHTYNYNLTKSPLVAGYRWRSNAYAFDLPLTRQNNPGNESSDTAQFLEKLDLAPPANWLMWRSLSVTDPNRRSEMIIFYVEFGKDHSVNLENIYVDDESTPKWRAMMPGLEKRANAAFSLTTLDKNGKPEHANWRHIPRIFADE